MSDTSHKNLRQEKEHYSGKPALSDSYERVASHLLGIFLFLFFTALVAVPILLLAHKIYPPVSKNVYVIYTVFILAGYGLWRFGKWID